MIAKTTKHLIFLLIVVHTGVHAQPWKIINYQVGYRVFDVSLVGNNPITIAPLLKDPVTYINYLNTISVNSMSGNPQIFPMHTGYVNAEIQRDSALSRFWKKTTIQAGLLFTTKIRTSAGAIGNEDFVTSPDSLFYRNVYTLTKNQQFFGANLGLNRRFNLTKNIRFLTGIHAQGSFALMHYYQPRWDSSTLRLGGPVNTKTSYLPNLKGKNFFQWQVMLPLGLEYAFFKDRYLIRIELSAGIIGNKYLARNPANREASSAGLWLVYKPRAKKK